LGVGAWLLRHAGKSGAGAEIMGGGAARAAFTTADVSFAEPESMSDMAACAL